MDYYLFHYTDTVFYNTTCPPTTDGVNNRFVVYMTLTHSTSYTQALVEHNAFVQVACLRIH